MANKEKLGKYVLLDEIGSSGTEYRLAKLGSTGFEKIVAITRLTPNLSSQPQAVKRLMEQFKLAAQLHNPNVTKILGIGKVDSGYYVCSELTEGKSLGATFARCRQEGFALSGGAGGSGPGPGGCAAQGRGRAGQAVRGGAAKARR